MRLRDSIFKRLAEEWRNEVGRLLLAKSVGVPAPEDDELYEVLPPALREVDAARQFVNILRNLVVERDVEERWTGELPKIIDEGIMQYTGKYFSLLDLSGGAKSAAKYARMFGIPTAAICRYRTKNDPTYRTVLAISPEFVRRLPLQLAIDTMLLVQSIILAVKVVGKSQIERELIANNAPSEVIDFFEQFSRETPSLHSVVSKLVDVSPTRQYRIDPTARQVAWGLISLLRYSPTLYETVSDIKAALSLDASSLSQMLGEVATQGEDVVERLKRLIELQASFVREFTRGISSLPPDFTKNFTVSLLHDAREGWNAILFHEVGHLVGEHTLPTTRLEDCKWINKYVAQHLVKMAQERGEKKKIKISEGVEIEITPPPAGDAAAFAAEVDRIRRTLDTLVSQLFAEESKNPVLANLYGHALNIYYDLIINNGVVEYLLHRSPTGVLSCAFRFATPHTLGLPLLSETGSPQSQLSDADIYKEYRRKVGEELAKVLWNLKEEEGGNGGGGNGRKGKKRVKGRLWGRGRRVWDWEEDDTGSVEDKGTIEEEEEEEKGEKKEEEREEEKGGEKKEEEEKGATDDEIKDAKDDLREAMKRALQRHGHGLWHGDLVDKLTVRPYEREEVPPPEWHKELRNVLEAVVSMRLQPQEPGEEKRSYYRESRKYDEIYVSRPGREYKINFVVVQDVSLSMAHLYDSVVSHFIGWLMSHQWDITRKMVVGVEKISVNIFFLPIDTVIHKIGWWGARRGEDVHQFAQKALLGVRGGGTDIYGVSANSLGLYHFIRVMFDPAYRENVKEKREAKEEEEEGIVSLRSYNISTLADALGRLGVFSAARDEGWDDALWVFIIATDHATELSDMSVLHKMVDILNSRRYMVFYLLYSSDKEQISVLQQIWQNANAVPITMSGYNLVTIKPGIFAFFIEEQQGEAAEQQHLVERTEDISPVPTTPTAETRPEEEEKETTPEISPPQAPEEMKQEEEQVQGSSEEKKDAEGKEEDVEPKNDVEKLKKAFIAAFLRFLSEKERETK